MTIRASYNSQTFKIPYESFSYPNFNHNISFQIAYCFTHFIISYYALGFLHWPNSLSLSSKDHETRIALVGLFYYLSSPSYLSAVTEWGFISLTLKYLPNYASIALIIASFNESFESCIFDQSLESSNNEYIKSKGAEGVHYSNYDDVSDVDSETTLGSPNYELERLKGFIIPDNTPKIVEIVKVSVIERQRWYPFSGWSEKLFNKDPLPFSVIEPNHLSLPNVSPTLLRLPNPSAPEKHPEYPIYITSYWLWVPMNNPELSNSTTKPQFEIEEDWTYYKAGWKSPQNYSDFGCVVRSRVWSCNLARFEAENYCELEHYAPFGLKYI